MFGRGRIIRRVAMAGLAAAILSLPGGGVASAQPYQSVVREGAEERAAERTRLFSFLARAPTESDARAVEQEIWAFWLEAPNAEAAALMNEALEKRAGHDHAGAEEVLDRLVELEPDWAEAWNQRATIRFFREDFEGSLSDIEEVLHREPQHFGALAGQAIILMRHGRFATAQSILRRAVEIHPYLRERAMIVPAPGEGGERKI